MVWGITVWLVAGRFGSSPSCICFGSQVAIPLAVPPLWPAELPPCEWKRGNQMGARVGILALGFEPIGRIGREVAYLSLVSHNCLELLLGYCKHAVINSWAQCLESLGKGSVQNARKHLRHVSVETSLVAHSSPSGACEGCWMSFTHRYPTSTWQPPCPSEIAETTGNCSDTGDLDICGLLAVCPGRIVVPSDSVHFHFTLKCFKCIFKYLFCKLLTFCTSHILLFIDVVSLLSCFALNQWCQSWLLSPVLSKSFGSYIVTFNFQFSS